jgi:predicted unusual protein kinase regulating ubiquinone biosynthesis (AarF/ABC1/UbiB family)
VQLSRNSTIAAFLMKYRGAGVFKPVDAVTASVPESDDEKTAPAKTCSPEEFVADLEALGPTFVKIGQSLSTRPDLVEEPFRVALEKMQDDVDPIPFADVRAVIESELGARVSKMFESFDEEPLAAASLAQVHAATLRGGRPVAVKVQRPELATVLRADIDTLNKLAGAADKVTDVGRRYRFAGWVEEFERTLANELDFRMEAANLERFRRNLASYPHLFVPAPIHDLTTSRVLTMDRVLGHRATQGIELRRLEQPLGEPVRELVCAYLDSVFVHGLIHADPHPGNLMLTDDGRLALIDLGMVALVPPRMRDRLFKLLLGVVDARGEDVAEICMDLGTRLEDFDEARFVRETSRLIAQYETQSEVCTNTEGRLLLDLTRLGADCALRPPPEITLLGKTLLNLDTSATMLDPGTKFRDIVQTHMQTVLVKQVFRSMSPTNLAGEMVEMHELMRDMPRRIHTVLRNLSDNRFRIDIGGLEEARLVENLQKIANRITSGLVIASLIIGAALMMRIQTSFELFGLPGIAFVMFMIASVLGLFLVVSALRFDRKAPPKEETRVR